MGMPINPYEEDDYFDDESDALGVIGFETSVDDDLADLDRGWSDQTEGLDWADQQSIQGTPEVDFDRVAQAIDRLGPMRSDIAEHAITIVEQLRQWYGPKDHMLDINLAELERFIHVMNSALSNPMGLVVSALNQMDFERQQQLLGMLKATIADLDQG